MMKCTHRIIHMYTLVIEEYKMKNRKSLLSGLLVLSLSSQACAQAAAPSFDCARAEGEVENSICEQPALIELDNMMAVVYKDAEAAATSLDAGAQEAVDDLKGTQRGWISGRNECWKEPDDKYGCIAASYEHRISWLQAKWSLVEASAPVRFECGDKREEFYVVFYNDALIRSAAVEYGDKREIFVGAISASGARYTGDFGRSLWIKGKEASLLWDQYEPGKTCKTS